MRAFIERYLGLDPAKPGEGTQWTFHSRLPWPENIPLGLIFCVGLLLILLVVWVASRDCSHLSWKRRLTLLFLRCSAIACVIFFLTELHLQVDRTSLPYVLVLVDSSASMKLEDRYPDAAIEEQMEQIIDNVSLEQESRLNLAKAVLLQNQTQFLKRLLEHHKIKLYQFSDVPQVIGQTEYLTNEDLKAAVPLLRELSPTGQQSRPGFVLRNILKELRGTTPSAVILFTDGITSTNDADSLTAVAPLMSSKYLPLFTIGIGSQEPARDIHLYDLRTEDVAFVKDPILFSASVKSFGFEGKNALLQLKQEGSEEILKQNRISLPEDGRTLKVEMTYTPEEEGEFEYILLVKPLSSETDKSNNSDHYHVSVRADKIRVLLVDAAPRYEFRYLKHLLDRNHTIELHTILLESDLAFAEQDQTSKPLKGRFPSDQDRLNEYDILILGDIDPTILHSDILDHISSFVTERGGGCIFIAGDLYNPLSFGGTPLEKLLPVKLEGASLPDGEIIKLPFRPQLTFQGKKTSSIFRFAESESESTRIWNNLAELYWYVRTPELHETSIVLAEHPSETGPQGRLPIIVKRPVGKGTVIFHATDETHLWRFRWGDRFFGRYWGQLIRHLTLSQLLGKTHSAVLETDRRQYQQGDPVKLWVQFLDERHLPSAESGVKLMLQQEDGVPQPLLLKQSSESPLIFEGQFNNTKEGFWRAWVVSPSFSDSPPAQNFRVNEPGQELRKRSLDIVELSQSASSTRGKFVMWYEAENILEELPPGTPVTLESQKPVPLWNRPELLLLFASVLLAEWLLRKRSLLV